MAGPLPYLDVCGVEVANAARSIDYIKNGLGTGHLQFGDGDVCSVLRRLGGGGPVSYISPVADPAPWYDPEEPGSATFLGVLMLGIQGYGGVWTRPVTPRLSGVTGGLFGAPRRTPREWSFRAALLSADDQGAEYGLRWLTDKLQQSGCDDCSACYLVVRLACPPDDESDDTLGKWTSYDAVLTSGPTEVEVWGAPPDSLTWCRDVVVYEWTMISGNPYLFRDMVVCVSGAPIGQTPPANCAGEGASYLGGFYAGGMYLGGSDDDVTPVSSPPVVCHITPPGRGALVPIMQVQTPGGMGGVYLEQYDDCPSRLWRSSGTTSGGDPGTGNVAFDNANAALAATVYLDDFDINGGDGAAFVSGMTTGHRVRVSLASNPGVYVTYEVTGLTDQSGWTELNVTVVASAGTPFPNSQALDVSFTDYAIRQPTRAMLLDHIPAGTIVTVDAGRQVVIVQDLDTGEITDGSYLLQIPEGVESVEWLVARECDSTMCFAARGADACAGGADALVSISTQLREG